MKHLSTIILLSTTAALLGACGEYNKEPVSNIKELQADAQKQAEMGPKKAPTPIVQQVPVIQKVPVIQEKIIYIDRPVPVEVKQNVYVPKVEIKEVPVNVPVIKEVAVEKEHAVIDDKFIVIRADSGVEVIEGQVAQLQVIGRSEIPGMKIELKASGLPEGARFEKSPTPQEKDRYVLSWTPPMESVPLNKNVKSIQVKITASVVEAPAGSNQKVMMGLSKTTDLMMFVVRKAVVPSIVSVDGLGAEVSEGSSTAFSVTAVVPGITDKSAQKPTIQFSPDVLKYVAGKDYTEQDATRYIIPDLTKPAGQYLGDFKWKFSAVFDTKLISVQPERDKSNNLMPNTDTTHVRMIVSVSHANAPTAGTMLKQLQIRMSLPFAAPRFDFSGLGADTLALTPGQTMKFNFYVASNHPRGLLKVEIPNTQTLAGSPSITCLVDAKIASKQNCTLLWKVPCAASDAELTQEIGLSAIATLDGKNSDATKQSLKTSRSKTAPVGCQTPKKPAAAAPAKQAKPPGAKS